MQGFEHVKTLLGKTLTCELWFFWDIRNFYVFFVHFGIIAYGLACIYLTTIKDSSKLGR
jgi:hypothetical protein